MKLVFLIVRVVVGILSFSLKASGMDTDAEQMLKLPFPALWACELAGP